MAWALGASVVTSYARARAEVELHSLSVGWMERGERFGVLIVAALTGLVKLGLVLIAVGATWTAIQRVLWARRFLREYEHTGQDPTLDPGPAQPELDGGGPDPT